MQWEGDSEMADGEREHSGGVKHCDLSPLIISPTSLWRQSAEPKSLSLTAGRRPWERPSPERCPSRHNAPGMRSSPRLRPARSFLGRGSTSISRSRPGTDLQTAMLGLQKTAEREHRFIYLFFNLPEDVCKQRPAIVRHGDVMQPW